MKNFIYYTPTKVYFGKQEEENIGKIISEYGFKKILLHYGMSSIKKSGLYDKIIKSLNQEEIEVFELSGVEVNPKIELVREGVRIVKENCIEFILAVGGGSVIDSAKSISNGSCVDFDPWLFNSKEKISEKHLPLGVILTLSASGSAMSDSCVITNTELKLKRGFNSPHNRPLFAILNPELTYTVSKYQTACGIVDSMMHTLERYLSNDSFEISDNIALAILKTIKNNALECYNNPTDYKSRSNIMWAESLSHNGLTGMGNTFVLLAHQLEHEISGKFDEVSHAAGLSAIYSGYLKYISSFCFEKIQTLGTNLFEMNMQGLSPQQIIDGVILQFKSFFEALDMPTNLSQLGIYEDSFEEMANKLTKNKKIAINGVIELNYQSAMTIFDLAK